MKRRQIVTGVSVLYRLTAEGRRLLRNAQCEQATAKGVNEPPVSVTDEEIAEAIATGKDVALERFK